MTTQTIERAVATITSDEGSELNLDVLRDQDGYFYGAGAEEDAERYDNAEQVRAAIEEQYHGGWNLIWN